MYECLQRHKKKLRGLPTNITIDFYKKARGKIKGISTVDLEVSRVIILTFLYHVYILYHVLYRYSMLYMYICYCEYVCNMAY